MSAGTRTADKVFLSMLPYPSRSLTARMRPVARRLIRCGRVTIVEGMIVRIVR